MIIEKKREWQREVGELRKNIKKSENNENKKFNENKIKREGNNEERKKERKKEVCQLRKTKNS